MQAPATAWVRAVQDILLDRRRVYQILVEKNIPVPTHIIVDRDGLPEGEHAAVGPLREKGGLCFCAVSEHARARALCPAPPKRMAWHA